MLFLFLAIICAVAILCISIRYRARWLCRLGIHIEYFEDGPAGPSCCPCGVRYHPALVIAAIKIKYKNKK